MTPEELRTIIEYLRLRVELGPQPTTGGSPVLFKTPAAEEMLKAGLDPDGVNRILSVPWWDEMVEDIMETPEMCEPDDTPEQVLEYARDVVSEYVFKRFPLEE